MNHIEEVLIEYDKQVLELQTRIDKVIEYMDNTYEISDLKELFEHYNNVEKILKGEKE